MNRRQILRALTYLAGVPTLAPAALTLLNGCAPPEADAPEWTPAYFTPEEARFITAYVDTLLPKTATPGGVELGVDRFIDKVMAATVPEPTAANPLRDGIRAFDADATNQFGKALWELDQNQRSQLFSAAEKSPRYQPQVWGTAVGEQPPVGFYRSLKSMALWGYLSTEYVSTELMNYDPVPGEYDGDISLASVGGKAWSL